MYVAAEVFDMAGLERYMSMLKATRLTRVLEGNADLRKVLRSLALDSGVLSQMRFRLRLVGRSRLRLRSRWRTPRPPQMSMKAASIRRQIPEKTNLMMAEVSIFSLSAASF